MNVFAKFLTTGSLAMLAVAGSSFAAEGDLGFGSDMGGKAPGGRALNRYAPQYFRPTQRYYGKGYTVAYRFIPWSDRMRGMNSSSLWDSEQTRLPTTAAATTYANGSTPRITYFYKHSMSHSTGLPKSAPLQLDDTPVSGIATTPKPLPPIGEATAKPQ